MGVGGVVVLLLVWKQGNKPILRELGVPAPGQHTGLGLGTVESTPTGAWLYALDLTHDNRRGFYNDRWMLWWWLGGCGGG